MDWKIYIDMAENSALVYGMHNPKLPFGNGNKSPFVGGWEKGQED